jgi:hypothetical protein
MTLHDAWRESLARILTRAAENCVEYPDFSVDQCLYLAKMEEVLLHGVPGAAQPKGIIGVSAIQQIREQL